jgi:glutamyl-tRNA synthetase
VSTIARERPASGPVGRLAPSPTGLLHLGHARSFLLAWWSVRSRGGRIVLRIEDLDAARLKPGSSEACRADLEWLGLDWDVERRSSDEAQAFERAAARLLEAGLAYPCVCTRAEVSAASAPQAGDGETRYPGTCRGRWRDLRAASAASGREAALRLRVPAGPVAIVDRLAGERSFDVQAEVGDFLLRRRDGVWGYQFAVVVDDARDGVSEVLRGDDLLPSAARQACVQAALGLPRPEWVHVPLVLDERGERLAKRRGGSTLSDLRSSGVDPRAVVSWAARSAGLDAPPRARPDELLARFGLERLPRGPHRLSPQELEEMRGARIG